MVKETPSPLRLAAMALFTMSVFALLLFLWLAFGGPIPLKPEGYRVKVAFPEAATLAQEADVRLAGVNVGKVKTKELNKGGNSTIVELELEEKYAPVHTDTRAILRQKTLLGETYVELAPGKRSAPMLDDGGRLADSHVEPTVELDEIFNAFDKPTRDAFQEWVRELSKAIKGGRSQDLNDAFGNLEGFAVDGSTLLKELDQQEVAVRRLIKNTGVVFGAINEREGALGELVVNANNTFEATASRDAALADTFQVFPTFLDESKATLARLETFSNDTRPLVNDLKGPADDLGPTVRDLGDLAPDLAGLFRDLDPLIRASKTGLPDLARFLRGAEPVFESAHVFFPELNPILSLANFHQATVAGFISQRRGRHHRPAGQARHRPLPDPDRDHQPAQLRPPDQAAVAGERQRLLRAERHQPRMAARRPPRELRLQAVRRRAQEPRRHRERAQAAVLRGAQVAVQRRAVQQAGQGRGARAQGADGPRGQRAHGSLPPLILTAEGVTA